MQTKRNSTDSKTCGLVVFVKNPVAGKVKTRLAASIGKEKALDTYLELIAITARTVEHSEGQSYIYFSQSIDKDIWPSDKAEYRIQSGKNLGDRMLNAFMEVGSAHEKVIIIGSDCPDLSAAILSEAIHSLEHVDTVIGPSEDGGYYLLGTKYFDQTLISDIAWSTSSVYAQTLDRVIRLNQSLKILPLLNDIDTLDDLEKWKSVVHA